MGILAVAGKKSAFIVFQNFEFLTSENYTHTQKTQPKKTNQTKKSPHFFFKLSMN